jgi:hypothetical protein
MRKGSKGLDNRYDEGREGCPRKRSQDSSADQICAVQVERELLYMPGGGGGEEKEKEKKEGRRGIILNSIE